MTRQQLPVNCVQAVLALIKLILILVFPMLAVGLPLGRLEQMAGIDVFMLNRLGNPMGILYLSLYAVLLLSSFGMFRSFSGLTALVVLALEIGFIAAACTQVSTTWLTNMVLSDPQVRSVYNNTNNLAAWLKTAIPGFSLEGVLSWLSATFPDRFGSMDAAALAENISRLMSDIPRYAGTVEEIARRILLRATLPVEISMILTALYGMFQYIPVSVGGVNIGGSDRLGFH